eukprot:CAMPEP_0116145162 /NCGR_PEP_ID=MMETSP0329-20121206/16425_1 /TAXON_ID=697910 /ORGANISM="Pseudo-nitzschia arenysensis, Strain B593" /LENGTH=112 /DNA_ID=CAMNT_0003640707 /DNA_START=27 /DNA_END=362 /DNA_ORIENTATION=+
MPGPMLPPTIVPEQSSAGIEKTTSRRSSDCIDNALAVLRSTKRRKSFDNEKYHQQRGDYAKKSQTPTRNQSAPIDPNGEIKDKNTASNCSGATKNPLSTNDIKPCSWEWSIG